MKALRYAALMTSLSAIGFILIGCASPIRPSDRIQSEEAAIDAAKAVCPAPVHISRTPWKVVRQGSTWRLTKGRYMVTFEKSDGAMIYPCGYAPPLKERDALAIGISECKALAEELKLSKKQISWSAGQLEDSRWAVTGTISSNHKLWTVVPVDTFPCRQRVSVTDYF